MIATCLAYCQFRLSRYQSSIQYTLACLSSLPTSLLFILCLYVVQPKIHANNISQIPLAAILISLKHLAKKTTLIYHFLIDAHHRPCITAAHQRLVPKHIILSCYILPHALAHALATLPRHFAYTLLSGTLLAEILFSIDGLGKLHVQALQQHDTPLIIACLVCYSLLITSSYLISDIIQCRLNPHIQAPLSR